MFPRLFRAHAGQHTHHTAQTAQAGTQTVIPTPNPTKGRRRLVTSHTMATHPVTSAALET